jgi:hypothetical protein
MFIYARDEDTIEKLLNRIREVQKTISISRIRTEDGELMMGQTVAEIVGRRIIAVVSPQVEVTLLYQGVERRMVATESWNQEQLTNALKAAVGGRGDKFLARRLGAEEGPWEVRAGHTCELVETSRMTLKMVAEKGKFDVKIPGTASIGEVAAKVSQHLKLPLWE